MKEQKFLEIIGKTLSSSNYLGDDCAYLDEAKIYITQDTLVEDVHFSLKTTVPFELGQKAIAVNVSDLCTTLGTPKWVTISLSMPKRTDESFVEEFYKGVEKACKEYGVEVVGGDITGSKRHLVISVCAIAEKTADIEVGRSLAKPNDIVAIAGTSGGSRLGLSKLILHDGGLVQKLKLPNPFIRAHLLPKAQLEAAFNLRAAKPERVSSMDTSDGLADALYKIANASRVKLDIDGNLIPVLENFVETCQKYHINSRDFMLYGGEDFALVATMEPAVFEKLDKSLWTKIGIVSEETLTPIVEVTFGPTKIKINHKTLDEYTFNHFEDN